jgi:hypothetical protein
VRRNALIAISACAVVVLALLLSTARTTLQGDEPPSPPVGALDAGRSGLTPDQEADLQRIATLGYISGSEPVPEDTGVLRYDRTAAFSGPTLYACSEGSAALLIDIEGNIIHSRQYPGFRSWGRAHVYENGDLLVITEEYPHLMKINRDSELIWEWNKAAHHDLEVLPDGSIAVLVAEEVTRPASARASPSFPTASYCRIQTALPRIEFLSSNPSNAREITRTG